MIFNNKKGVSVLIGYVLLITFVIFLGAMVYTWMKSYVPQEDLECPEDVSLFIKDYICTGNELNLTLKNNGKFSIGGYFIRVTDDPQVGLATIDISFNISSAEGQFIPPSGVKFDGEENSLAPNLDESHTFDISDHYPIYSVEIIPLRWQEQSRRKRVVSCRTASIREDITCN
jgi:hypothetical protein